MLSSFKHPNIISLLGNRIYIFVAYSYIYRLYFFIAYCIPDDVTPLSPTSELNYCLVYELADEGSIYENLKSDTKAKAISWERRLYILEGLCSGLNYLHCHKEGCPAYHRDIKSANVALSSDGGVKVLDLGLSHYNSDTRLPGFTNLSMLPSAGGLFGTEGHMCPIYLRKKMYNAQSEMYSVGIMICELLSGKLLEDLGKDDRGGNVLFEEIIDDVEVDKRAGDWPLECSNMLRILAASCMADRIENRPETMQHILQHVKGMINRI